MSILDRDLIDGCSELDEAKVVAALDAGANVHFASGDRSLVVEAMHGDDYWQRFVDEDEKEYGEDVDPPDEVVKDRTKEAVRRSIRIIGILLARGADINAMPENGWSTMCEAVHAEPAVAEFLLRNGADPNQPCSFFGSQATALQHAWGDEVADRHDSDLMKRHRIITRLFMEYGAVPCLDSELDPGEFDISRIRTFDDVPPPIYPVWPDAVIALTDADRRLFAACRDVDEVRVVTALKEGANPNARDAEDGFVTPLGLLVRQNVYDAAKGRPTPEFEAAWRTRVQKAVKTLLDQGADPNIGEVYRMENSTDGNLEGSTPLQESCWLLKDVELSRFLLDHGANPNFMSELHNGETIRTMNNFDYNVDDPVEVKPIEVLLNRYGGCCSSIFDGKACEGFSDTDKALVFACQRMDYHAVQLAVKLGGNLGVREWGRRCLPVIVMEDAPQLRGKYYADNGLDIEDEIINFVMFLLVGMKMPLTDEVVDDMLFACVDNGYEKVLAALLNHHKLGEFFQMRGRRMDQRHFPWDCWPLEKRRRMAVIIAGA